MNKVLLGIIREEKTPPDSRVPLSPTQCRQLLDLYPNLEIYVQSSNHRCFSDSEFTLRGIPIVEDISLCGFLVGIKEVPVAKLIPQKTYFFFSHTAKKQAHNKELLRQLIAKNIRMIDYEFITKEKEGQQQRILGFGYFAGVVGAHNGLLTWGKKSGDYELKPAYLCKDFLQMKKQYKDLKLSPVKIAVTGSGKVVAGVLEMLKIANIRQISPKDFLEKKYDEAVFTQLTYDFLYERETDKGYDQTEFYTSPEKYQCKFGPYTKVTDLMINGIFWDPKAPIFFSKDDMKSKDFKIKVIADITCDINGSVPATLKSTTIQDPVFGYNPITENIEKPFQPHTIDIMAVDNLPNELPRDASEKFGTKIIKHIIPKLFEPKSKMLERATICENGKLTEGFEYLNDFVAEKIN